MRFAAYLLNFNQDRWLLKSLRMIGPHVEKVYVAWSELPWTYNKNARRDFRNTSDPELLKKSEFYDKVELIIGEWGADHVQRNACLDRAREDGFDYLFNFDIDEFYKDDDLVKAIDFVKQNPDFDRYLSNYVVFWKNLDYVLERDNGSLVSRPLEFIVNLNRGNRFWSKRTANGKKRVTLDVICCHLSHVLTDDEYWAKLNTWSGLKGFDSKKWYEEKWINWDENTRNLGHKKAERWPRAVKRPDFIELPKVLRDENSDIGQG